MNDAREILIKELVSLGIPEGVSVCIALDAGSSQVIVNKEYIEKLGIQRKMQNIVLEKVTRFYSGYYEGV